VLKGQKAYNALDACKLLGLDEAGLDVEWKKSQAADKLVKLGGGFYCGAHASAWSGGAGGLRARRLAAAGRVSVRACGRSGGSVAPALSRALSVIPPACAPARLPSP
jgi:hypothetical protein